MKNRAVIAVIVAVLGCSVACASSLPEPVIRRGELAAQPHELPPPEGLILDEESYPITDGSTSAEPLGVWVACRLIGIECVWQTLAWERERRLVPVDRENNEDKAEQRPERAIPLGPFFYRQKLRHRGTHTAYRRLIEGQVDLIYECRPPSPDEIRLMEEHGVELDVTPIALDAFVFLRHRDNPVVDLTSGQVRDIYTRVEGGDRGVIDNWEQVGGPDAAINAYTRNPNSGSQETLLTLVMKVREIVSGLDMTGTSMNAPYNLIASDPAGIGFTFFYFQRYMAPKDIVGLLLLSKDHGQFGTIEMFAIDGVAPTRETIADGSYPWVTKVYAVTRKDIDPEHPAARLRDWLLTEEGQGVIAETGYVPLRK